MDTIAPISCASLGASDDDPRAPCLEVDFPQLGCGAIGGCLDDALLATPDALGTIEAPVSGNLLRFEPVETQPARSTNANLPWYLGGFRFASLFSKRADELPLHGVLELWMNGKRVIHRLGPNS